MYNLSDMTKLTPVYSFYSMFWQKPVMIFKYLKLYQSSCNVRDRRENENDINFKLTKYPLRPLVKVTSVYFIDLCYISNLKNEEGCKYTDVKIDNKLNKREIPESNK